MAEAIYFNGLTTFTLPICLSNYLLPKISLDISPMQLDRGLQMVSAPQHCIGIYMAKNINVVRLFL